MIPAGTTLATFRCLDVTPAPALVSASEVWKDDLETEIEILNRLSLSARVLLIYLFFPDIELFFCLQISLSLPPFCILSSPPWALDIIYLDTYVFWDSSSSGNPHCFLACLWSTI